jgi:serine/threonine-protein kinase
MEQPREELAELVRSSMSDPTGRCGHCGLPHEDGLRVCPTTGLRIDYDGPRPRGVRHDSLPRPVRPDAARWVGQVIDGKYELRGLLGQGGQSAVYEALHQGLERLVAIKLLHPGQATDPKAMARVRNEAQVVSAIRHPNICEIFDLGQTKEGSPYLVMERLVGETLADEIAREAPVGFLDLAPTLKQVLGALAFAHDQGVLHRDLKPENVFLERRRGQLQTKLLDFGISRWLDPSGESSADGLGTSDMIACTPYYMSPEQARGDSTIDQRVDLWAVGVILYEALTGRRPFVATNYNALLVRILTSQPRPVDRIEPETHPAVAELVHRALAKAREDRFQTASDFRRAISEVQEICLAEDSYAPTVVMRRRKRSATPAGRTTAAMWAGRIDDPDTCVDDELDRAHLVTLGRPKPVDPTTDPQAPHDNQVISNNYKLGVGVMKLPPPPRVEHVPPRAPASFARIHQMGELFPQGIPEAPLQPSPPARRAAAGQEHAHRLPPTPLAGPRPLFETEVAAPDRAKPPDGPVDPLISITPSGGVRIVQPGEAGTSMAEERGAVGPGVGASAPWEEETHTDVMVRPATEAEEGAPSEPHRPGPGQ